MQWSVPHGYGPAPDPRLQWCVMIFYVMQEIDDQAMRVVGPFDSRELADQWGQDNRSNLWYSYELFALERP